MSVHVCPQTLVLVDNDLTVSEVNQKLVKNTLKYMFYHAPEGRTFCLDTYEHDIEGDETFTSEINDLVCTADKVEFTAKDSNLSDTLTEVITRWKESDFACRDIVVFTDGLEGDAQNHEKEELYYLLENSEYPVYIVFANQEDNEGARKGLSAVAVTSGGKLVDTEFEGSDGAVDKKITEKIFSAMDEYGRVHWARYEEDEEEVPEDTAVSGSGEEADSKPYEEADSKPYEEVVSETYEGTLATDPRVVYEYKKEEELFGGGKTLMMSAVLIAAGLLAGVLGGFVIMKRRRAHVRKDYVPAATDEEELFDDYDLLGIRTGQLDADDTSSTVLLSDDYDRPTRLLGQEGLLVTLTDRTDPERQYRIVLKGSMSIGRSRCDVIITGDDALSKRHCELYEEDNKVFVRDLSSSNGTRVNGKNVTSERLSDGDELTIGSRTYSVKME
ncbi:MAG: FHA domain-containing protein [Lachnospiraceae bacterium]|nr:FHA domain-containing protein [Lachnospiraceae bacterium]